MQPKHKTILGVSIGTVVIVTALVLVLRNQVKTRGWSHSKLSSKLFNVPLVDKKYVDLVEQNENIATKDGIEFRADGSGTAKGGGRKMNCNEGGSYCSNGRTCFRGVCV